MFCDRRERDYKNYRELIEIINNSINIIQSRNIKNVDKGENAYNDQIKRMN